MKKVVLPLAMCILFFPHFIFSNYSLFLSPPVYKNSNLFQDLFQTDKKKKDAYSIKLVPAEAGTFGYEIYSNKKLLIKQINIPGQSGMKGFKRKADAQKVANLVVQKLAQGIMPPTVEKAEMDKLHVQY